MSIPALLVAEHAVGEELVHAREQGRRDAQPAEAATLNDELLQPGQYAVHSAACTRRKHACTC